MSINLNQKVWRVSLDFKDDYTSIWVAYFLQKENAVECYERQIKNQYHGDNSFVNIDEILEWIATYSGIKFDIEIKEVSVDSVFEDYIPLK